jgi:hypothetical protein
MTLPRSLAMRARTSEGAGAGSPQATRLTDSKESVRKFEGVLMPG